MSGRVYCNYYVHYVIMSFSIRSTSLHEISQPSKRSAYSPHPQSNLNGGRRDVRNQGRWLTAGEGDSGVAPIVEGGLLTQCPVDRCVKVVIWCEVRVRAEVGKVFKR